MKRSNVLRMLALMLAAGSLMLLTGCGGSSSDPVVPGLTADQYAGGLVWNNWTLDSAGVATYPAGFDAANKDFLRCKACHGWDAMGDNGGYVRRTAKATRPNPTVGTTDLTAGLATLAVSDVLHTAGRAYTTLDNTMPAYDMAGGLTEQQAADVLAFLKNGPKVGDFATLNTATTPVTYTFSASAATGATLYASQCNGCHGAVDNATSATGVTLSSYFAGDGKYSEGFHKIVYGNGGASSMTRAAVGDLSGQQAADILAYIQDTIQAPGDAFAGGLVWNNWTVDSAGVATYPVGITSTNKDFVRCKACHGWDALGANGGYVRRTANANRPNPTASTSDLSANGLVTAAQVDHTAGRAFTVYDNTMPAFDTVEGLTQTQVDDVVTFLNIGPKVGDFATIDTATTPATYTFSANAATGATLYASQCNGCHGAVDNTTSFTGVTLSTYFAGDGKYSEGFHKIVYGNGGASSMTRTAMGSLSGQEAADILAYIQAF